MGLSWLYSEVVQTLASLSPLFRFVQGLAFFVLGVAILFAAPRAARLEIGHRLPFLSVFAFCEAATVWDGVLASSLSVERIAPPLVQVILLGVGYGALLAFGFAAALPSGRRFTTGVGIPPLLLALWLAGIILSVLGSAPSAQVAFWGEIAARYSLALPGGLLALWGLRHQTYRSVEPRMVPLIRGSLRVGGVALGVFGILAGLILPSIHLLTGQSHARGAAELPYLLTSLPLTLCGAALTYGLTRTLSIIQWEVERWIEGVQQTQALTADRERIGRDLHDGIIQAIYAAGLMLEAVRQTIGEDPVGAQAQLSRAMVSLNQTIQDIRRYIFDLRGDVPAADLVDGLEDLLRDFRVNTLLETELLVRGDSAFPVGAERRRHILQIARETLSNVARHSQARRVEVCLSYGKDTLQLRIADDGVGLAFLPTSTGQGLRNIRERTRLLEGTLDIDSAPGRGMTVTVTVPYPKREVL